MTAVYCTFGEHDASPVGMQVLSKIIRNGIERRSTICFRCFMAIKVSAPSRKENHRGAVGDPISQAPQAERPGRGSSSQEGT